MLISTFALACGFALIHVFIGRLAFLAVVPRSRWLSAAGGVAVAYVFLHILPEVAASSAPSPKGCGFDRARPRRSST